MVSNDMLACTMVFSYWLISVCVFKNESQVSLFNLGTVPSSAKSRARPNTPSGCGEFTTQNLYKRMLR